MTNFQSSRVLSCRVFLGSQFSVYSLPSYLSPLCLPVLCFLSSSTGAVFLWLLHLSAHSRRELPTLTLGLCVLFSPHSDVASAPTPGLWALISLRLTLSASWSDWRLDRTDALFVFLFFCLELRLLALLTGRVLRSETLINI